MLCYRLQPWQNWYPAITLQNMQYDRYIQTLYSLLCLFCREAKHGPLTTHFFYYFRLKYPFSNYYKRKPVVERVAGRISPIPFLSTSNFSIANEHPMPGFVGSFHRIIFLITISVITNSSLVTMWVKGQFKTKIYFCYCRLCVYFICPLAPHFNVFHFIST